jgi:hypothetical protein
MCEQRRQRSRARTSGAGAPERGAGSLGSRRTTTAFTSRPSASTCPAACSCARLLTNSLRGTPAHTAARTMPPHACSPRGHPRTVLAAPAVQQPLQLHRGAPRFSVLRRAQVDAACTDATDPLAILLVHVEPAARWVALDLVVGRLERPCAPNHAATRMSMHTTPPPPFATRQPHSHKRATPRPPPHRSRPAWSRPARTAPRPPRPRSAAP